MPENTCVLWHVRASWERDQGVALNTDALSTSSLSQGREEGPEICLKLRALDANASGNCLVSLGGSRSPYKYRKFFFFVLYT